MLPTTFNKLIKAFFSNKKYIVSIQTRTSQILNNTFFIENIVLIIFLKIVGVKN